MDTDWDTGDNQLTDIEVSEEQFNRWLTNCKKNKSHTSWIYLDMDWKKRRKVYLIEGDVLYCNALDKSLPNAWHSIMKREN
jgi:alpha-glucosidase (family GH31 glycosyl hydrolase)